MILGMNPELPKGLFFFFNVRTMIRLLNRASNPCLQQGVYISPWSLPVQPGAYADHLVTQCNPSEIFSEEMKEKFV